MRALMLPFAAMALWATPAFASLSEVSAHLTAAKTMTADFVQTAAGGSVARYSRPLTTMVDPRRCGRRPGGGPP